MKVKLLRPIPGGDKLELSISPPTINPNGSCRSVTWVTTNKKKIQDFRIEPKNPKGEDPFETAIPTDFRKEMTLVLKTRETALDWEYKICWHDEHGAYRVFDPKIPIKPTGSPLGPLLSIFSAFLASIFSLQFLFKKFKRK